MLDSDALDIVTTAGGERAAENFPLVVQTGITLGVFQMVLEAILNPRKWGHIHILL
jgi:hypothetical protein